MAGWLVIDWLRLTGRVPSGFRRYTVCAAPPSLAPGEEAAVVGRYAFRGDALWEAARLEAERLGLRFGAWGGGQAAESAAARESRRGRGKEG